MMLLSRVRRAFVILSVFFGFFPYTNVEAREIQDSGPTSELLVAFEAQLDTVWRELEDGDKTTQRLGHGQPDPNLRLSVQKLKASLTNLRLLHSRAQRLPPHAARVIRAAIRNRIDSLTLLLARIVDTLPPVGLGFGIAPRAVEQFGVRVEPDLGTPACTQKNIDDGAAHCQPGPWLSTRAPNFINIKRTVFWRGTNQMPSGNQMTSSFVAERTDTRVAIHFAAEAYVTNDSTGAINRRMFVRALVDGAPTDPSDVVFAVGAERSTRSTIFTTVVGPGIHTVQIQWLVDREATGFLRNASLLVRTGPRVSTNGTIAIRSAPGGVTPPSTSTNAFSDIPDMGQWIYVPPAAVLTASLAGETTVTGGSNLAMVVRALVDGVPLLPTNVVFRRGSRIQSHAFTFGENGIAAGWHFVRFQWFAETGATATMADRSLALAAYPSPTAGPTHPFVSPPSGPNVETGSANFAPLPGLATTVNIPARGNGEVAAVVSAEVFANGGGSVVLALVVDGAVQDEEETAFTDGQEAAQAKTFTFDSKRLTPGNHTIAIHWRSAGGGMAGVGDRSLAVMSETGFIPDIAEALPLSPARYSSIDMGMAVPSSDRVGGMEPAIGGFNVLALLWDPLLEDIVVPPAGNVASQLFGPANSANDYFMEASGGRFNIVNAGVLGWFPSTLGADFNVEKPFCIDGYKNRQIEKRADAIMQADQIFDFSAFDTNEDHFLDWQELTILIVIPQANDFGVARVQVNDPDCGVPPLTVDGVEIPDVAEWFTNAQGADFIVAAHELAHQMFLLDDMYLATATSTQARKVIGPWQFSLMSVRAEGGSAQNVAPHPSPHIKLALGWVTPVIVQSSGTYVVGDVKTSNRVLVLPHYNHEPMDDEYYIVENRQENLPGAYDLEIGDSGIAIWHIVSDADDNVNEPRGVPEEDWVPFGIIDTQVRRATRLLRRFGSYDPATNAATANQDQPLWDPFGSDLLSGPCDSAFPDNVAAWANCKPSGYDFAVQTPSAPIMLIDLNIE